MKLPAFNHKKNKLIALGGCAAFVATVGLAYHFAPAGPAMVVPASAATQAVAAVVGGDKIYVTEVAGLAASTGNKATAVDAAINRAVLAQAAQSEFPAESQAALDNVRREALAQMYLAKKSEQLAAAVTETDLKAWYAGNITDADFTSVKVRYYLTQDQADANTVYSAAKNGDASAKAKFQAIQGNGDYMLATTLPYDMGKAVSQLKPGTALAPVLVREGYLVVFADDVKAGHKPTLEEAKPRIRQIIVAEKLRQLITERRAGTSIELKG